MDSLPRTRMVGYLLGLWLVNGVLEPCALEAQNPAPEGTLELTLRARHETSEGSGRFHTQFESQQWQAAATAIIVCDMWDLHHCRNATLRLKEMAPRMNMLLDEARKRGATIIHAPSGSMAAYENHPARQRAIATPRAETMPSDIGKWCHVIPAEEQGEYPLDQTDPVDETADEHAAWGKELERMGRNPRRPQLTQTDLLEISEQDFISDQGEEIWSVLAERDIQNVILLGVHTNMCVLGRPFGLRQMAKNGKNVVLMRDLTDTMYNPRRSPFVSHFSGTDLIVEHIEKWVCPTITSDQILGGQTFRFKNDQRPHVAIVMGEREYETDQTLPEFARQHLNQSFRVSQVFASDGDRNDFPGIEVLDEADVVLLSVRRRVLPPRQMAAVRRFIESGKSVVGVRTASHAFSLRGKSTPDGLVAWESFDHDVFGGNYSNHYGEGPKVIVSAAKQSAKHPILRDIDVAALGGYGSLYVVSPLSDAAVPLLYGKVPDQEPEPIAWTNRTKFGGRAFYTSLAHPKDFTQPSFNQLLLNAICWAADVAVPSGESGKPVAVEAR